MSIAFIFILGLLGAIAGFWATLFLRYFAYKTAKTVHNNYVEIFPQLAPRFNEKQVSIHSLPIRLDCHIICTMSLFVLNGYLIQDFHQALINSIFFILLYLIARIDFHYHFISMELCHLLQAVGILMAYFSLGCVNLFESIENAFLAFILFYVVYVISQYFYQREVFGQGDYWLISALATFIPLAHFPLFILSASISALSYGLWRKYRSRQPSSFVPFAPFLNISCAIIFIAEHCISV